MGLWGIKYSDIDEKWWVDVVLQEDPPAIRREKIGAQVVTDGFDGVSGPVLARKASIPPTALSDWPSETAVILTRAELVPDSSTFSSLEDFLHSVCSPASSVLRHLRE